MTYKELLKKAEEAKTAKSVQPGFFRFEKKGDYILGRYMYSHEVQGSLGGGTYLMYIFDTDLGLQKFKLGSAADKELREVMVPTGVYKIEFLGKDSFGKGKTVNRYDCVEVVPPENAEV